MKRLLVASLLCALAARASAAAEHDWYVLKADDGVYAYDAGAVTNEPEHDVKSVWILSGTRDGYDHIGYFVHCRTNRGALIGGFVTITVNGQEETLVLVTEGDANLKIPIGLQFPKLVR